MFVKIYISESAEKILSELTKKTGESGWVVLEKALEAYRRQCFLKESNAAFADLRTREGWRQEEAERASWDITLANGLEED